MNKPKVEFYNLYNSLLPWATYLIFYLSNLLVNAYVSTKCERHSMKNKRHIAERSFVLFVSLCPSPFPLHTWKCIQLEIRRKMTEKLQDAGGGKGEK